MVSDELEVTELDPSDAIGGIQPDEVVEVDDTEKIEGEVGESVEVDGDDMQRDILVARANRLGNVSSPLNTKKRGIDALEDGDDTTDAKKIRTEAPNRRDGRKF